MNQRWLHGLALTAGMAIASTLSAQSSRNDSIPTMHIHPAVGIRVGAPQRISAALGIVTGADYHSAAHPRSPDVVAYIEPGWSAGRVSLGIVTPLGNLGTGWGATATVLRTWNEPWTLVENRTYVGAELSGWAVFFVGPRIGLFHAITGPGPRGWYFTGDIGIGL
jgi:hypothetical protein